MIDANSQNEIPSVTLVKFNYRPLCPFLTNGYDVITSDDPIEEGLDKARERDAEERGYLLKNSSLSSYLHGFDIVQAIVTERTLGPSVERVIATTARCYFGRHIRTKISRDHGQRVVTSMVRTDAGKTFVLKPGDRVYNRETGVLRWQVPAGP